MKILCPVEERLAEYLEGRLSEEERSQMEEHLSDCQICLEGLVVTNSLLQGNSRIELEPVPTEVTEAAVHLIIGQNERLFGSLTEKLKRSVINLGWRMPDIIWLIPWGKWRHAPIRGYNQIASENFVRVIRVPFKGIKTEIEIEKTGADKACIRVKLNEVNKPGKAVRVTLKKGEREIASYLLEDAYALFEGIPFGHYNISLAEDGVRLGTFLFEIKESHHDRR